LISSIKVTKRPHGCGLFTINLSNKTLLKIYNYEKNSYEV
jgi:hypothetical protein